MGLALAGQGCGGGGSGGGAPTPARDASGAVTAAKVVGASVSAYRVLSDRSLEALGTTQTDAQGVYTLDVSGSGPFLLVAGGGTYVDEASGTSFALGPLPASLATLDAPRPRTLSALVGEGAPSGSLTTHLSPLTTLAVQRAATLWRTTPTALQASALQTLHADLAREFGLNGNGAADPKQIAGLDPSDTNDASALQANPNTSPARLGAVLAALSQSASDLGLNDPLELIDALAEDFSDGAFDGRRDGVPLTLANAPLAPEQGTSGLARALLSFLEGQRNVSSLGSAEFKSLLEALSQQDLASDPGANRMPSFLPLTAQNTQAGVLTTYTLESVTPGLNESQALTFTVSSSDPSVIPSATVTGSGATRSLSFTALQSGSATLSVTIRDDGGTALGGSDQATIAFLVTVTNTPPTADAQSLTTLEGSPLAITLSGTDPQGQPLTYAVVSGPTLGTLSGTAPNLTFTPNADAFGSDSFSFRTNDGSLDSAPATVSLNVTGINDVPSFTKGADQTVLEDAGPQSVVGWASAISAGPNEAAQTLSFSLTNSNTALFSVQPALSPAGVLTYTPAGNANGSATVTVTLSDDGGTANGGVDTSAAQTFVITVTGVNDAPSFTKGADQTVNEDAGVQSVSAWASAISAGPADETGQTLSFTLSNSNTGLFSVQPALSAAGVLTYTPAADAFGSATVTVTLSDNGGTANGGQNTAAPQTFVITVNSANDAPSFTKGADQTLLEEAGAQSVPGWASALSPGPANESSQTLSFALSNSNTGLFAVQPAISPAGVLSYTPAPNAFGSATVTVILSDSGGTANGGADTSAAQTFVITVTGVNDVPSFTKGADQTVLEDAGAQSVTGWASAVSAGPANESSQTLSFALSNTNTGLFAVQPAVSAAGVLTYTPAADANGSATVTVTLSDNGGTANGGVDTAPSQTFVITVTGVNDAPSFTKGADPTVNEDSGAQSLTGWATAIATGPADESSQTLSFALSNSNTGLFAVQPALSTTGVLTFTPATDANGSATVTVTLSDNGGTANGGADTSAAQTFVITVSSVNDVPSFTKGADQTVLEDAGAQSVTGWATAISAGPANESSQTLSFALSNTNTGLFAVQPAVSAAGVLTYTPAADANGSATVTVTLSDNGGTANGGVDTAPSQTFVITVTGVNDAPSFTKGADPTVNEDAGAQSLTGWATAIATGPADEASQTLSFALSNTNTGLFVVQPALSATGVLTFTPATDANGSATVTVTLTDNGGTANGGADTSAAQTFVITVSSVNDVPSFTKGADQTLLEDAGAQSVTGWASAISAGPANESSQTLSFALSNTNTGLFAVQPAVSAAGVLTYTPAADANGSATVTVTLSDNGGTANGGVDTTAAQTFVITVTSVNDVPSFTKGADPTVLEDAGAQSLTGWASAISAGAANESGQTLSFALSNSNAALFSAQPALSAAGVLTFTPAADANGSATVTLTLSDDGGTANGGADTSAAQTFVITVTSVNDVPSFTKGADQSVAPSAGAQTVAGWATAISTGPADEFAQTLSFALTNSNAALFSVQPSISPAGVLTYTAGATPGSATVSVTLSDDGGTANGGVDTSATQTFVITVANPNVAPTITFSEGTWLQASTGEELRFTVTASDANGDALSLTLLNPPAGSVFEPVASAASPVARTFRWWVPAYQGGIHHLLFRTGDGALTTTETVTIQVTPGALVVQGSGLLVGDVTGDGVLDVVAGAADADVGGVIDAGAVYVWAGTTTPAGSPTATLTKPSPTAYDRLAHMDLGAGQGILLGDVTGDGTLDIVVGGSQVDTSVVDAGAVLVWAGGPSLSGTPAPTATLTRPSPVANDRLGTSGILIGDVTADGTLDLVVGGHGIDTSTSDAGAVLVWAGGATLVGSTVPTATLTRPSPTAGDRLGYTANGQGILLGDVTGDGTFDLVVGGYQLDTSVADAGAVLVWAGGASLSGTPVPTATLTKPSPTASDALGRTADSGQGILLGEVTGDGTLDLVVGGSQVDTSVVDAGAVLVWAGGASLSGTPAPTATLTKPSPTAGDNFGSTLSSGQGILLGDVTGNGTLDLVVGGRLVDTSVVDAGAVLVWAGGASLSGTPAPTATLTKPSPTAGDEMGYTIAGQGILFGDVTGDGILDLVVGGSQIDTTVLNAGAVFVWAGGASLSGTPTPTATLTQPSPATGDNLGSTGGGQGILLGDVTGDATLDVVVGGSSVDTSVGNAGAVFVWVGGPSLSGTPTPTASLTKPSPTSGDQLGSIGSGQGILLGDVTGDGILDLVVGGSLIDAGFPYVNAGAVLVWAGGASLSGTPAPTATLTKPSLTASDLLGDIGGGQGILVGDVTGDGTLDVIVGGYGIDTTVVDAGAVLVWAGGVSLSGSPAPTATLAKPSPTMSDQLGSTNGGQGILLGDVTGDGTLDLVVAGRNVDTTVTDAGAILLWSGGAAISGTPTSTLTVPSPTASDQLGRLD